MTPANLSLEERKQVFERFLERYAKRGFQIISRSPISAELYKPAGFPAWLFKEQTLYVDIDEQGRIYVRKG
ncbi:MAG TPA: hypothetical protein VFD70_20695 [Anaerolineae bacterium]|nr:hypothetical protein [Anaerolineae bacterium]